MNWIKRVWRGLFKDPPPVVPGGHNLYAEIEKRKIEEGKKFDATLHDGWWGATERHSPPECTIISKIGCPTCDRWLMSLPGRPGILTCTPCNKAFIPPEVWEDPNFQQDITQHGCDTSEVKNVYGDPMPLQVTNEYDIEVIMNSFDATEPQLGPRGGRVIAGGKFTAEDLLDAHDRQLANEIDDARSFGRAYIEEKYGIPFSQWVNERKEKREGSEDANS